MFCSRVRVPGLWLTAGQKMSDENQQLKVDSFWLVNLVYPPEQAQALLKAALDEQRKKVVVPTSRIST